MFGNNAVSSSWSTPQQQPQTSTFGQPSTFGSGGGFGQPQQQPQVNPMFGGLTAPSTSGTAPAAGFGAFGSGTSTFGGAKPATGFGAFSGAGATTFGSGGAFGSGAGTGGTGTGTTLFGQPSTSTGAGGFGTSGLFGANKTSTTFGAAGSSQLENVPPVTTGTANPPFSVHAEKDPSGSGTLQYQSITCMPVYRGTSFEELRVQDYQQGRKTAGTFGQSASFGTPGMFGQAAQTGATSIFGGAGTPGQLATGTGAFGGFGAATQPGQGTGLFGQQQSQPTSFGGFGQQQPQQQQQPATGGGLFSTGTFGSQQKPTFGTGTFGGVGTGTFGQPQQPAGGLFQPAQQSQAQGAGTFGGTFGAKPNIFGGTQPTTQPGQGLFGAAPQQGQQQGQQSAFGAGGLFGQPPQPQQQTTSGGLFGNLTGAQQPAGGLFGGGTGAGGSLYGATPQQQPQQPAQPGGFGGSLFGANQPTGGGLFGFNKPAAPSTNLFGSTLGQNAAQQPTGATGFFGSNLFNKPAAPQLGTAPSAQMGGLGTSSMFGSTLAPTGSINATATAPGAYGTLTASVAQPIQPDLPIFSLLPPGPRVFEIDVPKKKAPLFVDIPTRDPIPGLGTSYRVPQAKIRGFSTSQAVSLTEGKPDALDINKALERRVANVGPDSFLGRGPSPALGSGGKQSVKKLILDRKVDSTDLFKGGRPKVTFSPALSIAAREREAARDASSSPLRPLDSPTPAGRGPARTTAPQPASSTSAAKEPVSKPVKPSELEEGEYWSKPDLQTLKSLDYDELVSVKDLVVGRVGYGEIHFLEPIDLTGLPKLSALYGQIIRFDDKECSVYPEYAGADKPSPGSGLNVAARIILVRCWMADKATREPIKDEKHPAAIKHLKRLKNIKGTTFESFDIKEGRWTFTVKHF